MVPDITRDAPFAESRPRQGLDTHVGIDHKIASSVSIRGGVLSARNNVRALVRLASNQDTSPAAALYNVRGVVAHAIAGGILQNIKTATGDTSPDRTRFRARMDGDQVKSYDVEDKAA